MDNNTFKKHQLISTYDSLPEAIMCVFFAFLLGARAFGVYAERFPNITFLIGIILFILKIIVTNHTIKEYIIIILLMTIGSLIMVSSGNRGMILYFMLMIGMKEVSVDRLIRVGTWTMGIIMTFMVSVHSLGLLKGIFFLHKRDGMPSMIRYALGYFNVNATQFTFFILMVLVVYSVKDQPKKAFLTTNILLGLFSIYLFVYTGGRTGFIAGIALLSFSVFLYLSKNPRIISEIASWLVYAGSFILLLIPMLMHSVDSNTTNTVRLRFLSSFEAWNEGPIKLFGRTFHTTAGEIENAQMNLLIQSGIVAFIIINVILAYEINRCLKKQLYMELAAVISIVFCGYGEPFLYNYSFRNVSFIFFGNAIFEFLYEHFAKEKNYRILPESVVIKANDIIIRFWEKVSVFKKALASVIKRRPLYISVFCVLFVITSLSQVILFPYRNPYFIFGELEVKDALAVVEYAKYTFSFSFWISVGVILICLLFNTIKEMRKI